MRKTIVAVCMLCMWRGVALCQQSQPDASEPTPQVIRLAIHAAPLPVPSLKYDLLPPAREIRPGNAALLYYQLISQPLPKPGEDSDKFREKIDKLLEGPVDPQRTEQIKPLIPDGYPLILLETGARRASCDWGILMEQGLATELPPLGQVRLRAKLLALKIRMEIAEGKPDEALRDLQTGLAFARHVGSEGTLIQTLIGAAMMNLMLEQVEQFVQSPDAPDLYWAAAALPRPAVDIRTSLAGERTFLEWTWPILNDMGTVPLSAAQLAALQKAHSELARQLTELREEMHPVRTPLDTWTKEVRPEARRYLLSKGYEPQAVQAMPAIQAAMIYGWDSYCQARDDVYQWMLLPYWQGWRGMQQAQERIAKAKAQPGASPILGLTADMGRFYFILHALERRLAILQCIEAIRLHAASHEGRLPTSLAEMTQSPAPIDPITGKEFVYKVTGNQAVLEGAAPAGDDPSHAVRYELTLVK